MVAWLGSDWDRGYVKGREQGIVEERARVVKLLGDMLGGLDGNYESPKEVYGVLLDAIALVEGEK